MNRESVKNNQKERALGNTEDCLQLESQKKTTRLVINLTLTPMVRYFHTVCDSLSRILR